MTSYILIYNRAILGDPGAIGLNKSWLYCSFKFILKVFLRKKTMPLTGLDPTHLDTDGKLSRSHMPSPLGLKGMLVQI